MKIITDIEQGTQEWFELRLGKATASNFKKIITAKTCKLSNQYDSYAKELAMEKFISNLSEGYKSDAMKRGNELEHLAREIYQEHTFNEVKEVAFIDCGDYGFSPDGLVGDEGLIEIKCMNISNHANVIFENAIPDEYYAQCQGALMMSGRKWLDFISYNPDLQDKISIAIIRILPDIEFIKKLKECLDATITKRNEYIDILVKKLCK